MKKIFIIDGHALCYRAYYAFIKNPLINSQGQNTSAIFGFAKMLIKLIKEQSPDYIAVAFDPPNKSFRFKIYQDYKANRKKMPDDLKSQIQEIKNLVKQLGIKVLESENHEADDIIGTVAKKYSQNNEVYIVTGDKDAYQLLNKNIKIYANKKGISEYEIYGRDEIIKKLGITPEQVIDYMALMGDTADNIPGVRGIGEKTAAKLISEYSNLDNIYKNIEAIKGKTKTLLEEGKEMAYLSKELVTIKNDLELPYEIEDFALNEIDTGAVEYFQALEMPTIAKDLSSPQKSKPDDISTLKNLVYRLIQTEEHIDEMISEIRKIGIISFDTETDSLSPVDANLVGMSFSTKTGTGWFLPLQSRGLFTDTYLEKELSLKKITPILEDENIKKIGQNIKYDLIVLNSAGIKLKGIIFDTMIASYLLDMGKRRHNMDDLALQYLNYKTITFKELTGTGKKSVPITDIPLERLSEYAIEDADVTLRLYEIFKPMLEEKDLSKLFYEIEMPLIEVLAHMEISGVAINENHFKKMQEDTQTMIEDVKKEIYDKAGQRFNINSTKELSAILFEKLGLKSDKKTKSGFSTDIQVLEKLQGSNEIIDYLISYRTLSKLQNTYITALPKLISPLTGRIHTSYNQTVVATGRLSSSDPNLQNIPIKDDLGKKIRKGFIAKTGYIIMSADYSQIELRLAAHYSKDKNMCKAFHEGIDIHNMTASSVFGTEIENIDSKMRRQAKIINFSTIYGVSPYGLSNQSEIGMKEAKIFIDKYFETYPGFKNYIEETVAFAKEHEYVETLLGRKRFIPEINSTNSPTRKGAERIAINTPIQGTSADMIKIAMINIHRELKEKNMKSKMIMQVHDELVFEVPTEEECEIRILIKEKMETALPLSVPIIVDIGTGKNWEEAH